MNKQKTILLALTLAMIAGTGWFLGHIHSFQRLGKPGVKTRPLAGSQNLEVVLPENVLDYESEPIPLAEIVTNTLPADTSYGQKLYTSTDGFRIQFGVVLMGGDRTSLHKPQFCLEGQGFQLGPSAYSTQAVPIERPYPYELSVGRLIGTRQVEVNGQRQVVRAIYVYYYVADGALSASASGAQRMWWMARDLIRTGVLQRWAYVSYLAICEPGQEDATFERMKTFIAASAPEFQLTPSAREAAVAAASK
jgi:Protein of unknown function (DUF3485)